jgi:outer membrane protein OmpA-like peptidoglycan-associated protein
MREMDMNYRTYPKHYLSVWRGGGIAKGGEMVSNTNDKWQIATEFVPIKFQNDGNYAIMYMGEDRVANLPNADFGRSRRIEFAVQANATRPSYLRGIVIATGLDDLYGALSSGQAWTTRGILFDVDSDVLRPESTPVLNEIERTLSQHEDLSIVIEGHTDSTGDDAHNLDLSERRAAAVVAWLTGQGIDAGRLTAVGKGETEPTADNGTLEGRQANRRVVVRSAG